MKVKLVRRAEIPELELFKRGKVRDIYKFRDYLLFVATDRVSCFDVILEDLIPYKGIVLAQLSKFWFNLTKNIIKNHLLPQDVSEFQELSAYQNILRGRSMLVRKTEPIPFECVMRGYLSGSGWRDYKNKGEIGGLKLISGLLESQKLPHPIFTPSIKAETGHDIAVSFDYMKSKIGSELADRIAETSIKLYQFSANYALERGIIIADTKFEFGLLNGELILIDELLTPDSSRFWPQDKYQTGRAQESFDKQYLRDWLESVSWDKIPPAPELPPDIIQRTSEKYLLAYKLLAGKELSVL